MASLNKDYFSGSTGFTGAHDEIQAAAVNTTWLNEFSPRIEGSEKRIAGAWPRVFHTLALCCAIAGEFAVYLAGKLVSRPDSITIYIACHPQKWSSDISVLLQIQRTRIFSLDSLLFFLFIPECSIPAKILNYVIKYGKELTALRIVCIESVKSCGPRPNMHLTHKIWPTFEYYCANYAMIVLQTRASNNKIVYVRHYQAEIDGDTSRLCGQCVCITKKNRAYYDFGCKKSQHCTAQFLVNSPLL